MRFPPPQAHSSRAREDDSSPLRRGVAFAVLAAVDPALGGQIGRTSTDIEDAEAVVRVERWPPHQWLCIVEPAEATLELVELAQVL